MSSTYNDNLRTTPSTTRAATASTRSTTTTTTATARGATAATTTTTAATAKATSVSKATWEEKKTNDQHTNPLQLHPQTRHRMVIEPVIFTSDKCPCVELLQKSTG
jgi:hypothetical protein